MSPSPRGPDVVSFGTIPWYYPPTARDVTITPGYQTYAVGSYQPETKFVQVTVSGFNETTVAALHGVTPVTWINPSSSLVTFSGGPFQQVRLESGQSYTYTFTTPETFEILRRQHERDHDSQRPVARQLRLVRS